MSPLCDEIFTHTQTELSRAQTHTPLEGCQCCASGLWRELIEFQIVIKISKSAFQNRGCSRRSWFWFCLVDIGKKMDSHNQLGGGGTGTLWDEILSCSRNMIYLQAKQIQQSQSDVFVGKMQDKGTCVWYIRICSDQQVENCPNKEDELCFHMNTWWNQLTGWKLILLGWINHLK